MRRFMGWLLVAAMLSLPACGAPEKETPATRQIVAMDTAISFTVCGENGNDTIQEMVEEVYRLEKLLSRTDPESAVSQLNRAAGAVAVESEVSELLQAAGEYSRATGGAFDATIAPVMDCWGFTKDSQQVPTEEELTPLLECVGMENVTVKSGTVVLQEGAEIDLGGIAKGYASDCLETIVARRDIKRGWVSLGGNVLAWGGKTDEEAWNVGIQDPKSGNNEGLVGIIGIADGFAVTSGGYQRFFEKDGEIYHHIIDPENGYPADRGILSVTVVADRQSGNGTMCDAFSTALFVMGEEKALEFWRNGEYSFDMVLVTEDDRVLITPGIAEGFTEIEGSGYTYETIS